MIIWNGFGFLVAIIGFGSLLLTEIVSESITENERSYQQNPWVILIGMTVAAILTYGLHKILSRKKGRIVIDKETGQEFETGGDHSLFFIQVKWWPLTFIVLGLIFAFSGGEPVPDPSEEKKANHSEAETNL